MSACSRKFSLLTWKNFVLYKRHILEIIAHIAGPTLILLLLLLIRMAVKTTDVSTTTSFQAFEINTTIINAFQSTFIPWSPNSSDILRKIMQRTITTLKIKEEKGFENEESLLNFLENNNMSDILCGIQFNDDLQNAVELPQNIAVEIRFPSELRNFPRNWMTYRRTMPLLEMGPRNRDYNHDGYPVGYNSEGFLAVQQAVSIAIMKELNSTYQERNITMRRYPHPPYKHNGLILQLGYAFTVFFWMAFIFTFMSPLKSLVVEKEVQLKETLKILGIPNLVQWFAWFFKSLLLMMLICLAIVIVLKVNIVNEPLVPKTNGVVLYLFFLILSCANITFSFLVSAFIKNSTNCVMVGMVTYFLSFSVYIILLNSYRSLRLTRLIFLISSVLHNTAMAWGFEMLERWEQLGDGIQWNTLFSEPTNDDKYNFGEILLMLLADSVIHLLLTFYVEGVYPGDYGVKQPWNFPFTKTFWCGNTTTTTATSTTSTIKSRTHMASMYSNLKFDERTYESGYEDNEIGIEIRNLKKSFKKNVYAVKGLSLNIYKNQITILLGHNGAGKTTTMSMLAGIIRPTSGTAIINGYDIRTDIISVRNSLGVCPQHNVLYNELTVTEHMYFFGRMKGLMEYQIYDETETYLKLLNLEHKANMQVSKLSGGMKRKLSVCLAFCGGSKIVMLDEPSAGVDPLSRRYLWEFLKHVRQNRTILITTHFMDEADVLGDRIAIMSGGELQCCGSSFFLKKLYMIGYNLTIEKTDETNDVARISDLVLSFIPNAHIEKDIGTELTYVLPEEESKSFPKLLVQIERRKYSLGIVSYGISHATLENVFMRAGAEEIVNPKEQSINAEDTVSFKSNLEFKNQDIYTHGFKLNWNHFQAMILKRFYFTTKSWTTLLIQLLLPIIWILMSFIANNITVHEDSLPALKMSPKTFGNSIVMASSPNNESLYENYIKYLQDIGNNIEILNEKDLETELVDRASHKLGDYRTKYIAAASFNDSIIIAWFNNDYIHMSPVSLNLIHNAMLREITNDRTITIINHPIPFKGNPAVTADAILMNSEILFAFYFAFAVISVTAFYIMHIIRERVTKIKHLQFISGMNSSVYWISNYLWDMWINTIIMIIILGVAAAFQVKGFSTFEQLGRVYLVMILAGHTNILASYALGSEFFTEPASGWLFFTLIQLFLGPVLFITVHLVGPFSDTVPKIVDYVFTIYPSFAISAYISSLYKVYCEHTYNPDSTITYFQIEKPGGGRYLIAMFIVSVISYLFLLFKEHRMIRSRQYFKPNFPVIPDNEDEDVARERETIEDISPENLENYTLIMKDLTKFYKEHLSVNRLSVGIKSSECFGLLGLNGAGKTTTFRMLTGDMKISYGDAWINGHSIKHQMGRVRKCINYCPQFDALLDNLTGRETLTVFLMLRGVPKKKCKNLINEMAKKFGFYTHLDKLVGNYSGGNKRKLSAAVAAIGNQVQVVYMDEPSTGMDPASKQFMWTVIRSIRDSGKCIILTSHSMEECEALCTRIAIMVNGEFKCLGSIQHLKSRFSEGYHLTIKMSKSSFDLREVLKYFEAEFGTVELKESNQRLLTFFISNKNLPLSKMFEVMEKAKEEFIEDYSLGQCTLEHVFLYFVRDQKPEDL